MLNFIYTIQDKLAAEGTSIDHIIALFIALLVLMIVGYLVECELSSKEKRQ